MKKIVFLIFIVVCMVLIGTYKPKRKIKIYKGDMCMINEVVLVGKVAYDPIFYETKENKIGKIGILITTLRGNMTEFEIFECEGDAEEIEKFKKNNSVVVYGKLKNDNNNLKIIITKIRRKI